jgi:hypothetical protein
MRAAMISVGLTVCLLTAACGSPMGGHDIPSSSAPTIPHESTNAPAGGCSRSYLPLPDPKCTPGAINPDVRQDTIRQTICTSGWTSTIRPPAAYTDKLKIQQIKQYGYSDTKTRDYEEDHYLPLEDGGNPTDPKNLWPQPHNGAPGKTSADKDKVENRVREAICSGQATLTDAQHAMLTNWTTALDTLGIH